jgi:multidrug efflux pump subunit AcrA (membrane-fusion protein)
VARGNRVTFTVEAYPDREFEGRVERIAPKATIVSGVVNYEVMIAIDSAADALKPDMTSNVSIRTAERQALVVPSGAIQREGDTHFVLVEQQRALTRRSVSVGGREGGTTEVKKGLVAGDRVLMGPLPDAAPQGTPR